MSIEIKKEEESSVTLVMSGELIRTNCEAFRDRVLKNLTTSVKNVYLDMRNLVFIDSSGLGMLIGARISAEKMGAKTIIVSPSSAVKTLLAAFRFDQVFEIQEPPAC